jgi:hypothetical protein
MLSIRKVIALSLFEAAGCTARPLDGPALSATTRDLATTCAPWQLRPQAAFLYGGAPPVEAPVDRAFRVVLVEPIVLQCTQAGPITITRTTRTARRARSAQGRSAAS